jgi:hypothetical protein
MNKVYFLLVSCVILSYTSFTLNQNVRSNETSNVAASVQSISEDSSIAKANHNNLTGRWKGNDGGIYYIRQIGDEIFWFGESRDEKSWTNVYHGSILGERIIGSWAHVPTGKVRQAGAMELKIESSRRIVATEQTGGFSGTIWQR